MYRMSGIGRYQRNIIPLLLPQLKIENVRVIGDISQLKSEPWTRDPRVEILSSKARIYGLSEQMLALSGSLRRTDILWVPHYNVPLLYRGKLLVTIHDVCPLALRGALDSSLKRTFAKVLFQNVARRADEVFCVSEFTSKEVQKYLGIPQAKVHVTHPGLEARWDDSASSDERVRTPYLLCVGNIKPHKNIGALLKAFNKVRDHIPHRLVIVGKLEGLVTADKGVVREAEKLGSDRVELTGEISDQRLKQLYRGADSFILPSLYEGFGLPVLEAMALNCPVLCSNASALPEVAGDAALYFDPRDVDDLANKLLRITSDGALRAELIERGLRRIQQFSYQDCAKRTADVINNLITRLA
jgi:glycosyltransferase involved in cell wall biosynthesis